MNLNVWWFVSHAPWNWMSDALGNRLFLVIKYYNNNQPKCDGLFGFTMYRPFHLFSFSFRHPPQMMLEQTDQIRSVFCFVFCSFPLLLTQKHSFTLFGKHQTKTRLIHLIPTINVYAFDGDLINLSIWAMRTTQSTLYTLYFALMHEIKMTLTHKLFKYRMQYEKIIIIWWI